ncbi:DUF4339 domain-containing protein [Sorangium sp. So ce513]|uniref:DUF4339 domain-containing protein n=1 Tax=Sorangium sp. So ce513 TaxID=3133315 RepID=UPI003F63D360
MKPPPLPARHAAPPTSARRPAPPVPVTDERETLWHVAVAPDDIKVLTLDKLDDLFRLDLIDESTKIWRPGMATWQPLGVVAGLDTETPEPAPSPAPGRPGPVIPRAMDSDDPTPVVTSLSATALLGPMDCFTNVVTRTEVVAPPAAMLAASRPTPPPPQPQMLATMVLPDAATPAPHMMATMALPAAAPASQMPASQMPASQMPASQMPSTMALHDTAMALHDTIRTGPRARNTGRAQRVMLALSVVAGLTVTLYRNDVLLDAARSAGRESEYQRIESALGGPGFGTPRSLEKLGLSANAR